MGLTQVHAETPGRGTLRQCPYLFEDFDNSRDSENSPAELLPCATTLSLSKKNYSAI